ncbi:hypothetical protein N0M98_24570 [Paenibacillus doosanensis]|uniref:hypothetical protein n=1 Tax=Paenibacillus doosanensis TaxID=1229154 RepID=UPI0021800EE9|nr:hypothetical protein [Paenibacillus doosanensis]MCS7463302.1 hypothetical protein [Paenibacillus doosanensis]
MYALGKIANFFFYLSPWAIVYLLYRLLKVHESRTRTEEELHRKLEELTKQVAELKTQGNA